MENKLSVKQLFEKSIFNARVKHSGYIDSSIGRFAIILVYDLLTGTTIYNFYIQNELTLTQYKQFFTDILSGVAKIDVASNKLEVVVSDDIIGMLIQNNNGDIIIGHKTDMEDSYASLADIGKRIAPFMYLYSEFELSISERQELIVYVLEKSNNIMRIKFTTQPRPEKKIKIEYKNESQEKQIQQLQYDLDKHKQDTARITKEGAVLWSIAQQLSQDHLPSMPAIIDIIDKYVRTWTTLHEYDENRLELPQQDDIQNNNLVIDYSDSLDKISYLKTDLIKRGEATSLFGIQRDDQLQSILANLEQTMFGDQLYKSTAEKAANLLYMVIKDHPFIDGNKRIGSFLFLLYIQLNKLPVKLDNIALTAVALLLAESQPSQKDLLIRLVVNLLA